MLEEEYTIGIEDINYKYMDGGKKKKIILIEDDFVIAKAIKERMSVENFSISSTVDGEIGLELVKKEKPDLILLDLVLPKMHGLDVLRALKKNEEVSNIPVMVLTNLGKDKDKKESLKLGVVGYFVKADMDLEDVVKKIKKILN